MQLAYPKLFMIWPLWYQLSFYLTLLLSLRVLRTDWQVGLYILYILMHFYMPKVYVFPLSLLTIVSWFLINVSNVHICPSSFSTFHIFHDLRSQKPWLFYETYVELILIPGFSTIHLMFAIWSPVPLPILRPSCSLDSTVSRYGCRLCSLLVLTVIYWHVGLIVL